MKFRIPTEKPAGCQWCCWSLGRQEGIRLVLWCQERWWPLWWTIVFAAFILEVPVAFRYLTYLNVTDVQMEEENQIFGRKKRILTSVAIILNIWTTAATKKIACKGQNMTYLYVFNYSAFASSAPCILIWIFKYCYKHRVWPVSGRAERLLRLTSVRYPHISKCNKPERPQNDFLDTSCVQCLFVLLSWAMFWLMVNIVTDVPDPGAVSAEWPLAAL